MPYRVVQTLSSRLMKSTLLCALGVGLLISALQIAIDFSRVKALPDQDMAALVNIILEPATAIVFSLDAARADELLNGMLSQPAVAACRIKLEDGTVFAQRERPLKYVNNRKINDVMFGRVKNYVWALKSPLPTSNAKDLGELEIQLDTFSYGKVFLERAFISMAASLLYAHILTGLLLLIFYLLVTKPLTSVIRSIGEVADTPEKARLSEPKGHADSEIGLLVQLTNERLDAIDNTLGQLRKAELQLKKYTDGLEEIVAARTKELSTSLRQLEAAKDQLIQSEKMAALGGLVAGVAHEVNTPLGIAVTAASVIDESLQELKQQFDNKTLSSEAFSEHLEHALQSEKLLLHNINRAANLIRDFKKTAVDQISESRCEFDVEATISALIASLHPETRKVPVAPELYCPAGLKMNSLPGVLTQIIANLIMNSIHHAFFEVPNPQITISVKQDGDMVLLEYLDNGVGVPESLHQRIFEPFFTSRRNHGGSGLGLNIVYNLVARKLGGRIEFESSPGCGVKFTLFIPRQLNVQVLSAPENAQPVKPLVTTYQDRV
ncbi:MAG: ATP-binding protein [Methylococcales bacterium]